MNEKIQKKFTELLGLIKVNYKSPDISRVERAFEFAKLAHAGEKRLSGEDFVGHPLETSITLVGWKLDIDSVIAGLIHDTIEHGAATKKDIFNNFGKDVLDLVEGVTKVSRVKLKGSNDEEFVENLRKMFLAMARDLRVVMIRFAERIDNLKTLEYLPVERRIAYAKESLEIFSPLSERLDMWDVKTQIDELAFKHAFPKECVRVKKLSETHFRDSQKNVNTMREVLIKELKKVGLSANVYGRKKGLYSIFNKLQKPEIDWDINKIHDVVALRVIVEEVNECYLALGILHSLYKPVPYSSIRDFISVPKPNGYRSIHTNVFGPQGKIAEVQVRTYKMHEEAEFGVSSHIAYGEAKKKGVSDAVLEGGKVSLKGNKLEWVKQLAKWQNEIKDSGEFLKAVKFDALSQRIFVFTPQGDVYDLPINATPIDFAYSVHTGLGHFVKLAKVNGKIVPLNYKLKSGEIVEIEKSKNTKDPNGDWLDFVVTTVARREISKQLRRTSV